jgi:pepF/M3 family oligoendopeptidase
VDDDPGRVDRPTQTHLPLGTNLLTQASAQVAGIGAGSNLLARTVEDRPCGVDRERVVSLAGKLVHRGEVAQLHGKSVERAAIMASVATTETQALPNWDLTPFFPSVDSPELAEAFDDAVRRVAELRELFDQHEVGGESAPTAADATLVLEEIFERLNDLLERVHVLGAYLGGSISVDSRDQAAQARMSELMRESVTLTNLETRLTGWIGNLDLDAVLERSETAKAHEYALRRTQVAARHLMSEPEEELAAELDLSGATPWAKLHGDLTSQIVVEIDGRELPMSEVRNLATNPNRDTRRTAYEAELAAWEANAVPIAAALNSIKGQVNTLGTRRGWDSPLDEALFGNSIDRETLDAMLDAVREALPDLRRYLRAKAGLLGLERLAWYDVVAPVGDPDAIRTWEFGEARVFILEQFGTYSDRMRTYAQRAFDENWIDAEPRAGKRDGAFCMHVRADESRILANFSPSYFEVSTLAHELGHGYHNINLASRTQIQQRTPMTLAETASTFCETIVRQAALAASDSETDRLQILEAALQTAFGVTVDILSRFLFESRVFEQRLQRELSVGELRDVMLDAQEETYGDGVDPELRHPYMWAVKPHYYSSRSFYNFPYTFGLLFGLGLYARYEDDPDEFRAGYDDLLSSTGLADAATLAARFGIDTRAPEFWRGSLDVVRADIDAYEQIS